VRAQKEAKTADIEKSRALMGEEEERERGSAAQLQAALSEGRSSAAKWQKELALQQTSKSNLLDEVTSLKSEAKELTDAHGREVERLQERLQQLETVHDTLDVQLAEDEEAFEETMSKRREEFKAKVSTEEETVATLAAQHEETRTQLADVRATLSVEQRECAEAEEAMREAREMAQQKAKEVDEREARLRSQLDDIQSERKQIEGEAKELNSQMQGEISRLKAEMAEITTKHKESSERASEFERQWVAESKMRKDMHNQLQEMVGNLRVYCRVRPASTSELAGSSYQPSIEVRGSDTVVVRNNDEADRSTDKKFEFTHVYGPQSSQEDVFRDTEPLMVSVLDGFNVCIFAYGQSGTGKTFTMEGSDSLPGLVPRAMARVFEVVGEREAHFKHDCFLSMIEIYNESIRDLLSDPKADVSKKKYDIMRDPLVGMYVRDLTSEPVHTASHCKTLIKQGNLNRSVAATGLNDQSSRSHMLVTLTVRTTDLHSNEHYVGKLSLVDLAGSERLSKSQTSGAALKETQAINKSLSALGTVIAALASQEKHVPFRDSKLTYMLQDSLGGNSKTLMFVNAGPSQVNYPETINSLTFASRAKGVALGKATKNREGGANSSNKASTTLAAANKLGDSTQRGEASGNPKKAAAAKR